MNTWYSPKVSSAEQRFLLQLDPSLGKFIEISALTESNWRSWSYIFAISRSDSSPPLQEIKTNLDNGQYGMLLIMPVRLNAVCHLGTNSLNGESASMKGSSINFITLLWAWKILRRNVLKYHIHFQALLNKSLLNGICLRWVFLDDKCWMWSNSATEE